MNVTVDRGFCMADVDGTQTGSTSMGVFGTSMFAVGFMIETIGGYVQNQGGVVAVYPTISIGTNSPNYDNILPSTLLSLLGLTLNLPKRNFLVDSEDEIFVRVASAATGVSPVFDFRVFVSGSTAHPNNW